jgi:2-polyprenyl-3-methyl-5-hydroxy-6-metoxy-1,4-benzoquinol methylase
VPELLDYITSRIYADDPKYGATLQKHLNKVDGAFCDRAESFFRSYQQFVANQGKTLDFGLDCFRKLRANVHDLRVKFVRTGQYASRSFDDVNTLVYANADIMESYLHGLVFAQFLWPEQYCRFRFFSDYLAEYSDGVASYLEIGAGHGLYVTEAMRLLRQDTTFDLVDISASSVELAKGIAGESRIRFHLMDVFKLSEDRQYDFITMGEILEHMENPVELLAKARKLLTRTGHAYITTPANAPMMDHIYLFRDADEIRAMLRQNGFTIEREVTQFAADLPVERCIALKTALMFAAFVKKA